MAAFPGPEFHIQVTFRAPLRFVYDWCTDYTPRDAALEGEKYERKVLAKTARKAVFEDLEEGPDGWYWGRSVVTLHPPRRWNLQRKGNRSEVVARYLLTELTDGRVRLDLWWRRRTLLGPAERPSKRERERSSKLAWERFARALERDYRLAHPAARR